MTHENCGPKIAIADEAQSFEKFGFPDTNMIHSRYITIEEKKRNVTTQLVSSCINNHNVLNDLKKKKKTYFGHEKKNHNLQWK